MLTVLMTVALMQMPDPCMHDRAALLALPPAAFDQDVSGGWRPLADRAECVEVAADLLAAYREVNWGQLDAGELHLNYWHEGQLRAVLGQRERAMHLLMAGVNPEVAFDGFGDYALGTVAFLNGDLPGLLAARDRLAATPEPPGWAEAQAEFAARFGGRVEWPMNLAVLDGLIACFGRSYAEAYGDCRPTD